MSMSSSIPGRSSSWAALLLLVAGAACGGDAAREGPTGSDGAELFRARLVSPAGSEGGALFELAGAAGITVRPEQGRLFSRRADARLILAVVRSAPGAISFLLEGQGGLRGLEARVLQVSDGDGTLRPDLTGYRVDLEAIR